MGDLLHVVLPRFCAAPLLLLSGDCAFASCTSDPRASWTRFSFYFFSFGTECSLAMHGLFFRPVQRIPSPPAAVAPAPAPLVAGVARAPPPAPASTTCSSSRAVAAPSRWRTPAHRCPAPRVAPAPRAVRAGTSPRAPAPRAVAAVSTATRLARPVGIHIRVVEAASDAASSSPGRWTTSATATTTTTSARRRLSVSSRLAKRISAGSSGRGAPAPAAARHND